jgi:hypothetical protein
MKPSNWVIALCTTGARYYGGNTLSALRMRRR